MDAAEYKHVVLGLIFLKYVSDTFEELFDKLKIDPEADEDDEDEYIAQRVFWVPKVARWNHIKENARNPQIGQIIDDAMREIEKKNPSLRDVLSKDYARPSLNKTKLGELVDHIGTIGLGGRGNSSKDVLGNVYEFFLGEFALAEGKKGGQFHTPPSVVRTLVKLIRPFNGRIYDPCCGSGGMFVESDLFLKEQGSSIDLLSIYAQESNPTTWRLFRMNLAMRKISVNHGLESADTFLQDLHPDLRADYVLANPPFNQKDWGQPNLISDPRWSYGVPPKNNANFAWIQHIIHRLSPTGVAGIIMANSSLTAGGTDQDEIRKELITNDLIDCIVALPNKLFHNTGVPASIWIISKRKSGGKGLPSRKGRTLFIDARKMGQLITRKRRQLSDDEIHHISNLYYQWKQDPLGESTYSNIPSVCYSTSINDIKNNNFFLPTCLYLAPRRGSIQDTSSRQYFDAEMRKMVEGLKVSLSGELFDQLYNNKFDNQNVSDWGTQKLGDILELLYGKPLKKEDRNGGDIPVYGSGGIAGYHDAPLVSGPGIVVGRKGNPGIVSWTDVDFFPIDTAFYVKIKNSQLPLIFVFNLLKYAKLTWYTIDSGVPGLNRNMVYNIELPVPSHEIIVKWNEKLGQLLKTANNELLSEKFPSKLDINLE